MIDAALSVGDESLRSVRYAAWRFVLQRASAALLALCVVVHLATMIYAVRHDLTAAANLNKTKVTKIPDLPAITTLPEPAFVFDRGNRLTYEEGTPETKLVFSGDYTWENLGFTAKAICAICPVPLK